MICWQVMCYFYRIRSDIYVCVTHYFNSTAVDMTKSGNVNTDSVFNRPSSHKYWCLVIKSSPEFKSLLVNFTAESAKRMCVWVMKKYYVNYCMKINVVINVWMWMYSCNSDVNVEILLSSQQSVSFDANQYQWWQWHAKVNQYETMFSFTGKCGLNIYLKHLSNPPVHSELLHLKLQN
jgi:hypothetical protein